MSCEKIKDVTAREILDSRGNPTMEVEVTLDTGKKGIAAVPSGASTGKYEAYELRDGDDRYDGKGVLNAVKNVNEIINTLLKNKDVCCQNEIDQSLIEKDGTVFKTSLGANAILGTSLACAKTAAKSNLQPLYKYISKVDKCKIPMPMMNILNGGEHSNNNIDFQEFMIIPIGSKTFKEGLEWCVKIYHTLKNKLHEDNLNTGVGDEGGFAPDIKDTFQVFEYLIKSVKEAGYKPGKDIAFAIDAAASELYNKENCNYVFKGESKLTNKTIVRTTSEMVEYYKELIDKYPIISIEDGLDEEDFTGWISLNKEIGDKIMIVGDDLFVTNENRLRVGIEKGVANAILIKPNQVGTLSETISTIELAQKNGYITIMSHRSGETEDVTIADLAVGLGTPYIKTGAPCRSERVAKYNRLLKIEQEII